MNVLEDIARGGGGQWYHCSVKTIGRSAGRSAVAAASYRLGISMHDEQTDITHDYTRRSGVVSALMLAPVGAPEWAYDPEAFWNAAEKAETRKNSRVAREVELALPDALTPDERKEVAIAAAKYLVDRYQVGVSIGIHEPSRRGDDRNHHVHLMFSTRRLGPDGFGAKTREWDDKTQGVIETTAVRQHTAVVINEALERAGHQERVDARSYKDRGIERAGTKHLGPVAREIERRGHASDRGDRNRQIEQDNAAIDALVAELALLDAEIASAQEALLDTRFGPADAPGLALEEEELAAGAELVASAAEPKWYAELQEPLPVLPEEAVETLMNNAADPYLQQIEEHGTLQDGEPEGMGMRWHERIAVRGAELLREAIQWVRGKWETLIANRRGAGEHYGSGPDVER